MFLDLNCSEVARPSEPTTAPLCRAKSTADFINKLKIVEEESDESIYWMELLVESDLMPMKRLSALMKEGDEILSIVVASLKRSRTSGRS